MTSGKDRYDVIIVGSGLSGTMLGSILAKGGFRVLLLDGVQHPRFAIGESTVGYTLVTLRLIAERYGVPEIANLASFPDVLKNLGTSHGIKTNFGFQIHRDGEEPDPGNANMFRIPPALYKATHYFRQDTDAYMFATAIRYGCDARQNYRVEEVDFTGDGVRVRGGDGTGYDGRYLVDASGFRSPLANRLGLREQPPRLKHHARGIFTHMVGVARYDDHMGWGEAERPPVPFYTGTMHHMFERGWMWVIPFDNHENATNPLCSVGIQLDPRRYPKPEDMSPEEEFWSHVRRFPAVERQLRGARSVREWVGTPRMQYSSTGTVGERWCLMSHAAGFVDPLFSRGLSNTCEVINALAYRLMAALREDDFDVERFRYVERLEQGLLDYNDRLVNGAMISFSHYDLWNALFRFWACGNILGTRRLFHALEATKETGDDAYCAALDDNDFPGLWWPTDFYAEWFDELTAACEAVDAGDEDGGTAGKRMIQKVRETDWMVPAFGFAEPGHHYVNPTADVMKGMAAWVECHPREEIRRYAAISQGHVAAERTGRHLY